MAYRETGPPEIPDELTPELQALWQEQIDLGEDAILNGFLAKRWRVTVDGYTGKIKPHTWLIRLTKHIYEMGGSVWGKRNMLAGQAEGSTLHMCIQAVADEVNRGPEGNSRVEELMQEGARPLDTSSLHYIRTWLASVQVARAVLFSQEDRERRGREIMYQWLRGGNSRRR